MKKVALMARTSVMAAQGEILSQKFNSEDG